MMKHEQKAACKTCTHFRRYALGGQALGPYILGPYKPPLARLPSACCCPGAAPSCPCARLPAFLSALVSAS
jgi:hypothetical protein